MTTNTVIPFEDRVEKAAKILKITAKILKEALKESGVDDIELLNASTTCHADLQGILMDIKELKAAPMLKIKAVAAILKGEDPFGKVPEIVELPKKESNHSLVELIRSQRHVTQWTDEEVLTKYIETDDEQYEAELQRRSKNRRFIILKEGSQTEVDIEASIIMLKRARREEIPSFFTSDDKKIIHIYKIESYHIDNRVRYESPLRPGVILFDGFCHVSNQNFKKVDDRARKFLRLIHEFEGNQSRLEETNLVNIAEVRGVNGLGELFPEILELYMEREATDSLPSLKTIAPVETRQADPFYQKSGNRKY